MRNTERFIKQWQKKRQKGKFTYILINSLVYCIVYWVVTSLFFMVLGRESHKLIENFDVFIIFIIIYIISLFRMSKESFKLLK